MVKETEQKEVHTLLSQITHFVRVISSLNTHWIVLLPKPFQLVQLTILCVHNISRDFLNPFFNIQ
jgi:hypothetical protein